MSRRWRYFERPLLIIATLCSLAVFPVAVMEGVGSLWLIGLGFWLLQQACVVCIWRYMLNREAEREADHAE